MKKFIALLLAGCMLLAGCGQQETPDVPADTVVEDVAMEDTASGAAVDVVSDSAVESEDVAIEEDENASTSGLNIIYDHNESDPPENNSTEYFPEVTDLTDVATAIGNILPSTFDFKSYEYSIEHRRFDFLESGDNITNSNFTNAGDFIVNEYLTENELPTDNFTDGRFIQSTTSYYRAYINKQPEIDYTKNYTDEELNDLLKIDYTLVYILKTIDDPNNGLTVLIIKNVPSQEVPV